MAHLRPLRGIRYDTSVVDFGAVLAPPYDVIGAVQRQELYARDLRNIVRIDYGADLPGDVADTDDRYTRARGHLESWLRLGILRRDEAPALYVVDHDFLGADGRRRVRRGVLGRVPAKPWDESEVLPHERTLRGPKADRLALMRSTRTQTSAVWVMWDRAPGIAEALAAATARPPDAAGEAPGELDVELLRMWAVTDPAHLAAIDAAMAPATLYIADGHHRFETAAAYAAERRAAEPDAPDDADFGMTLVYASAADDPVLEVWPTHRLVRAAGGAAGLSLAALRDRLGDDATLEPSTDLPAAAAEAAQRRATHHAFAVQAPDGTALLTIPRREAANPRESLDVSVLADQVLRDALGISADAIAGGALTYTRDVAEAAHAVQQGEAALAFTTNASGPAEIIAVSDAGEVMPQKSTYFYPKVATGLVLSPL
ncbi:MAG TPA: DUF1015 domain-containing protein [Candidatus Dormibacteraeota bacterium]|jgi:uncharacterized protein (DUF1015 family)|nr:DUF1015 domain-containing protein [Candidatus Dormibacteraeota bacterium]